MLVYTLVSSKHTHASMHRRRGVCTNQTNSL